MIDRDYVNTPFRDARSADGPTRQPERRARRVDGRRAEFLGRRRPAAFVFFGVLVGVLLTGGLNLVLDEHGPSPSQLQNQEPRQLSTTTSTKTAAEREREVACNTLPELEATFYATPDRDKYQVGAAIRHARKLCYGG